MKALRIPQVVQLPLNEHDVGPFDLALLLAIWGRFARAVDALHEVGWLASSSVALRAELEALALTEIDDDRVTKTLRLLALQDGMHARDWLRVRAAEALSPRRKPPPATDLQIRLRGGLQCDHLIAQALGGETPDDEERYRVTIRTTRGDVIVSESHEFEYTLDSAFRVANSTRDRTEKASDLTAQLEDVSAAIVEMLDAPHPTPAHRKRHKAVAEALSQASSHVGAALADLSQHHQQLARGRDQQAESSKAWLDRWISNGEAR